MDNEKTEIEYRLEAFAELMGCELDDGECRYRLDRTEMYLLRDGVRKMSEELKRLRFQLLGTSGQ
jgi:hypothetical protein